MTQEQQEALLKNLESQLKSLDSAYNVESQRQMLLMKQKLALRKEKVERAQKLRDQLKAQEEKEATAAIKKKLGGLFKKQGTINLDKDINDNSELMKRLRAWKIAKRSNEEKLYAEKVAKCEVDLDEAQTKIMILKLLQTEKMLKEIRRQVKKFARPAKQYGIARQSSRMSGVRSIRGSESNLNRMRSQQNGGSQLSRRQSNKPSRIGRRATGME
jgi:hypothetical protein